MDLESRNRWPEYTEAKEEMFLATDKDDDVVGEPDPLIVGRALED